MNRIVYFDPEVGGHHPIHILSLVSYWEKYSSTELVVLLHPAFPVEHAQIWTEIQGLGLTRVGFGFFSSQQVDRLKTGGLIRQAFRLWHLLAESARQYPAREYYSNSLDLLLIPLALGFRLESGASLAGIVFRPTLHYRLFKHQPPPTTLERIRRFQKRVILQLALRNAGLGRIFCLDPYAAEAIQALSPADKVSFLPEPFLPPEADPPRELWDSLAVTPSRKKFLLFGVLSERKGIFNVLAAAQRLSQTSQQKISLVFVGRIAPEVRGEFLQQLEEVGKETGLEIRLHDAFISNQDAWRFFLETDVVLAVYSPSFVGSSGLLIWAAYAQKPVLATNYGMIGQMVSDCALGLTVDPRDHLEIAAGLEGFLQGQTGGFNLESVQSFAAANSSENYARTIIATLEAALNHPGTAEKPAAGPQPEL